MEDEMVKERQMKDKFVTYSMLTTETSYTWNSGCFA